MLATSMTWAGAACDAGATLIALSALLRTVARGDLLFRRILAGGVLHQRLDDGVVGGEPVGDHLPLFAVPLVDAAEPRAFMVGAGDLDRSDHAFEAELLDAL